MLWINFIGEGRSGQTILSAILDSHPNARIGEEQKSVTKWWRDKKSKEAILEEVKTCGHGKERKPKALPGSLTWEEPLLFVGDKCGWDSVNLVRKQGAPDDVLDQFSKHMGMPVKTIHTIRDPHENISSWVSSPKYQRGEWARPTLDHRSNILIRRYKRFYGTADKLLSCSDHFDLYNEEFCSHPKEVLTRLCEYLGLPIVEPWFSNAVASVFKKPNRGSDKIAWSTEMWNMVGWRIIDQYDYFERYKKTMKQYELKHYLVTEWNVDMIDMDWLRARQILFEKFTLPSVMSQTNKDFTWILVSDSRTPDEFKKVLDGYPAEVLYFDFENYEWPMPYHEKNEKMKRSVELELIDSPLRDYINKDGVSDATFIITSRLDNDDAISVDHIEKTQREAQALWTGEKFWLNLVRGYKWCDGYSYPVNSPRSAFISFVEKPSRELKTTYQTCHTLALASPYPVECVRSGRGTWLQVIHGKNLLNRLMRQKGKAPFDTISEWFKING